VDFVVRLVPTAKLSGTILDPTGQPTGNAAVTIAPKGGERMLARLRALSVVLPRTQMSGDGFSIAGVLPGEYRLIARTGAAGRGAAAPTPGPPTLWSETHLSVSGEDQPDLALRLQPGLALSGSVAFSGTTLQPPADLSTVAVSLLALEASGTSTPTAKVTPTGTFTFASVMPGLFVVRAAPGSPTTGTGPHWTLKSAMLDGRDLADVPIDAKPGETAPGLVLTFTDRDTEISGVLLDAAGRPTADDSIVVCTTNRALWLPQARRVQFARPATNGRFSLTGLPAGEYDIGAVADLDPDDLADPAFLERFQATAMRITLADGEKKVQNWKVGSGLAAQAPALLRIR
jgi:hypothetical protein